MKKAINKIESLKSAPLILLCYSIALKFFMSMYSIRFSEVYTDNDGSIYYIIGKAIMHGKVLYKDIFDHKTPYVFFANAAASLLEKNHLGLFILEIAILFVTLLYTYKFAIFFTTKFGSLICAFYFGIILNIPQITFSYSRTEEYAIAFMMVALFLFSKYYFLNDINSHNLNEIANANKTANTNKTVNAIAKPKNTYLLYPMYVIGILAGLTFMTNIRSMILFVPFAISLMIICLREKKYLQLVKLFFAGIIGVVISFAPYIIYMILTDSVKDAYYAIFTFNFNYLNSAINDKNDFVVTVLKFIKEQFIVYIITFASFIALLKLKFDKYLKYAIVTSLIIAFIYITFSKRPYPYYLVIFTPYFLSLYFVLLNVFDKYCSSKPHTKSEKIIFTQNIKIVLCFVMFVLFGILISYKGLDNRYKNNLLRSSRINSVVENKFKNKSDLKVLSYGFLPEVYVFTHTIPKYKYFMIPNVAYKVDNIPYDAQYNYIISLDPDLIVFRSKGFYDTLPKIKANQINFILSSEYTIEDTIKTNEYDGDIYIFARK